MQNRNTTSTKTEQLLETPETETSDAASDPSSSAVEHLRDRTGPLHDAVEKLPFNHDLMSGQISAVRYAAWLRAQLPPQRAIEACARRTEHPVLQSLWTSSRMRSDLIVDDLRTLGHEPSECEELVPDAYCDALNAGEQLARRVRDADDPELFGAMYVLEGASMGGIMIAKQLRDRAPELAEATEFLTAYGDRTRPMWAAFRDALDDALEHPEAMRAAGASAERTFRAIGEMLEALGAPSE